MSSTRRRVTAGVQHRPQQKLQMGMGHDFVNCRNFNSTVQCQSGTVYQMLISVCRFLNTYSSGLGKVSYGAIYLCLHKFAFQGSTTHARLRHLADTYIVLYRKIDPSTYNIHLT